MRSVLASRLSGVIAGSGHWWLRINVGVIGATIRLRDGRFYGCRFVTRIFRRTVGRGYLSGRSYHWPTTIRVRQDINNCTGMGPVWFTSVLVGLCWVVPGITILAGTIWKFVDRFRQSSMASTGPPGKDIAVDGTTVNDGGLFIDTMILIFAGHLGVSRTVYRLLDRVYWHGLCENVRSYLASCSVCLARKSPCPRRASMGHVLVSHRVDLDVDILDMSVITLKGKRYVLVTADCFLIRRPWLLPMHFSSLLSVGLVCRRSFIWIKVGNLKTIWCSNYVFCVVLIKLVQLL